MTNIAVETTNFQVEKRGWLQSQHGTEPGAVASITLDISTFTAGTHYPNGYIPSGTALAKITATGLYGPYAAGASDGRQTPANGAFLLFSSVKAVNSQGTALVKVGAAGFQHGFVESARLPFSSGDGAAVAAVKTALPLIVWN